LIDIDRYTFRGYIPTELGVITTVPTCSTPSITPLRGTLGFHHRYVQMLGNDASTAKQFMFTRFHSFNQWEFQEPQFEVPTIYKAYFSGLCKGMSPENMAKNMVQYLHVLDPEIPIDSKHRCHLKTHRLVRKFMNLHGFLLEKPWRTWAF